MSAYWDDHATSHGVFGVPPEDYDQLTNRQAEYIAAVLDIDQQLQRPVIVDLGCGIGRLIDPVREAIRPVVALRDDNVTVVGVDSSEAMLRATAETADLPDPLWFPEYWAQQKIEYDGVYCVLMFQHIPDLAAVNLVADVAALLRPGARFVSQWLIGDPADSGDMSYPRREVDVFDWCRAAGLKLVQAVDDGFVTGYSDEWVWIVAEKP